MALFDVSFFIVFSFLLLPLQPSKSVEFCGASCGTHWIRFPFRLNDQSDRCGYPRFNLSCKNHTETIFTLPLAGEFSVETINYKFQTMYITDPNYCTARRLLKGLNFSTTPFELLYPQSYTFLNCSLGVQVPEGISIACLSGENFSVVALPTNSLHSYAPLVTSCSKIATVMVSYSDPNHGISLTWNKPDCWYCESSGGTCMFKSDTGLEVKCSGSFNPDLPTSARYGLIFGLGIPLMCILGFVFYLRSKVDEYNRHQLTGQEVGIPVGPRRLAVDHKGLNGSTIEAYPTTKLGKSGELPRPDDNTCPICLCEYRAKETLRTIPDCKHYFHASCIDEWLKLNATCPVCRYSTERSCHYSTERSASAPAAASSSSSSH